MFVEWARLSEWGAEALVGVRDGEAWWIGRVRLEVSCLLCRNSAQSERDAAFRRVRVAIGQSEDQRVALPPAPAQRRGAVLESRRRISCTSVTTMRAPVEPSACPSATELPLTFTMSSLTPSMRVAWTATDAKASLISITPRSPTSSPALSSAACRARAGTVWR